MKKKISIIALLAVLIVPNIFAGSGQAEREVRKVKSFNSVSANSGIDVFITQGSEQSVEVEASKNSIHRIITEVKGETLHIYVKGSFKWNSKDIKKVYITAPEFKSISAGGGADVRGVSSVKAEILSLNSSGGADIYLSVETTTLKLNCSGGADISVNGTTEQLRAVASGGSDIKADKLMAKYVDVSASGGGDAHVFASEKIVANASGGGDVHYTGSPKEKDISESGGGDVSGF
ncbi:DUF2807 domain-containing protein [Labilibacter sediminis]|nr:DUF2807 domain-containing protein [Labilibacter sediminis]